MYTDNLIYIFQLITLIWYISIGFHSQTQHRDPLLRVINDLEINSDSKKSSVLVLLDLTAAYDNGDHDILIHRLHISVSLNGSVCNWFSSYLKDRAFHVAMGNFKSAESKILSGVPQGSVLRPLILNLYMLPLGIIIKKHNISYHSYANDTQLYISLSSDNLSSINKLINCIQDINLWMTRNFLQLNEENWNTHCWSQESKIENLLTLGVTISEIQWASQKLRHYSGYWSQLSKSH